MAQPQTLDAARQPDADAHAISDMYLIFLVGEEEYGVGIEYVTEIVGLQRIMSVPDVPRFIRGVINLRGNVIPVMDVRMRFGLPERAYDARTVIVVLEVDEAPVGLVVDAVRDVREIAPDCIDPSAISRAGSATASVTRGVARHDAGVSVILDIGILTRAHAATAAAGPTVADAAPVPC